MITATTPEAELGPMLVGARADVLAGGHWHFQLLRRHEEMILLNPGSVGLAYSHHQPAEAFRADPWAEYALLEVEGGRVELTFRRLPYDVTPLLEAYVHSGRPHTSTAIAQYQPPPEWQRPWKGA